MESTCSGLNKSEATENESLPKIPFQLGAPLKLSSVMKPTVKARTTVVGVLPGIAILVEEPSFSSEDRIAGRVGGDIFCVYFHDGCVYRFKSRFREVLIYDTVCIDYPKSFKTDQLRMHPRIKVNLEAVSVIGEQKRLMNGEIKDISIGGCCLELPGVIPVKVGTVVIITFELPNDVCVDDIECIVRNMSFLYEDKKTVMGLGFLGPIQETTKISKFCEMCSYFRL